jgi:hypothetical protein
LVVVLMKLWVTVTSARVSTIETSTWLAVKERHVRSW